MSKFIEITLTNGIEKIVNASTIRSVNKSSDGFAVIQLITPENPSENVKLSNSYEEIKAILVS